jgi:hypothetical protein
MFDKNEAVDRREFTLLRNLLVRASNAAPRKSLSATVRMPRKSLSATVSDCSLYLRQCTFCGFNTQVTQIISLSRVRVFLALHLDEQRLFRRHEQ